MIVGRIINFTGKFGLVGLASYYTYKSGFWSQNDISTKNVDKILEKNKTKEILRIDPIKNYVTTNWNDSVNKAFGFLQKSPEYASKSVQYVKEKALAKS